MLWVLLNCYRNIAYLRLLKEPYRSRDISHLPTLEHPNFRRGVGVYVRDSIQINVVNPSVLDISLIESVWLDISIANKILRLGCVYRSTCAPSLEDSWLALKTIIYKMASSISLPSSSELIIIGDFYFPAIEYLFFYLAYQIIFFIRLLISHYWYTPKSWSESLSVRLRHIAWSGFPHS